MATAKSSYDGSTALDPIRPAPTAETLLQMFPDDLELTEEDMELAVLGVETMFVAGDSVVISGSVRNLVSEKANLRINGHEVPFDRRGNFCATVRMYGAWLLTLSLETESYPPVTMDLQLKAN